MTWVPRLVREDDRGGPVGRRRVRVVSAHDPAPPVVDGGSAFFHFPDQIAVAEAELAGWLADGTIVMAEHVLDGFDRYPEALEFMFSGRNVGKLLVKAT